ncbi:hypothetical protein TD95_001630 [Thielaviopsis punctulata]|uniref:Major facilitator superfamily (MFS) profile domain-containing protein n=1 Tax=Thielaviopsis punctulata TaxID=72032 RepID=A0A0F4Z9B3_9PEZI|nr:hypothetical protein TD95_001630 [Thielaviopsis punctulata]
MTDSTEQAGTAMQSTSSLPQDSSFKHDNTAVAGDISTMGSVNSLKKGHKHSSGDSTTENEPETDVEADHSSALHSQPQEKAPAQDPSSLEMGGPPTSFDDPRDMRNPKHWGMLVRIFHTIIPGVLAFQITFSTSIMIPALAQIMYEFQVNRTVALLTLTLYTLGLAFGPPVIAPLSEVFGRKYVYLFSSTAFLIFTGCCTAMHNFAGLLVMRFLAGFFGSSALATGAGTIADVWGLSKAGAYAGLLFILGPFLGPTLGPLAGAYIMESHSDWRWTLYTTLILAAPIWLATAVMRETSKVWILRNEPGHELDISASKIGGVLRTALTKPIKMLLTDSVVLVLALYSAYAYALVFSYFASTSFILQLFYRFTLREVGLSFIAVIIGYIVATAMFGVFTNRVEGHAAKLGRPPRPELRLLSACVGSILLPASLFWYAWEVHVGGKWAAEVASGILFGWGAFSIFLSIIIYQVEFFGAESGASAIATLCLAANLNSLIPALAANGVIRYIMGAVFPLFTVQMYENLGVHWAGSTFAFLAVGMIPIPFLLYRFGEKLRKRSKFTITTQ